MRASGLRVPDDVQVIGFDNIEESAYLQIPLTTMDSRLDWTAPTAVGCILGRIQGDAAEPKLLPRLPRLSSAAVRGKLPGTMKQHETA